VPLIALFGPHAVGKTTAARRWVDRYKPRLVAALCDVQRGYDGAAETRVKEWKGTFAQKAVLLAAEARRRPGVFLIETGRGNMILPALAPDDAVVHVYCSPARLRENLRARAARLGKKFNEPYWDDDRCGYEARRRLDNCAARHLRPGQMASFKIDDYARDWPAVDAYFGSLFRKLHNGGLRR
jgi:hypothetical protein